MLPPNAWVGSQQAGPLVNQPPSLPLQKPDPHPAWVLLLPLEALTQSSDTKLLNKPPFLGQGWAEGGRVHFLGQNSLSFLS